MSRRSTPADDGRRSRDDRPVTTPFATLVARVGRGDRDAFATVYDRIAPALFRIACSRGLPPSESEVVVEQVLLRLWWSAPRYAEHRNSSSDWLLALVDEALGALALGERPAGQ